MKSKLILGLLAIIAFVGCSKVPFFLRPYFEPSESGRQTLAFFLNKKPCYQYTIGRFSEYPRERALGYDLSDDVITVRSRLTSKTFPFILISAPQDALADNVALQPDIRLGYLYLPKITHDVLINEDEYGGKLFKTIVDRNAEYRLVNISESSLLVRRWDPEAHIFAGDFSFKGHYVDSSGKKHTIKVTDGVFDVTDEHNLKKNIKEAYGYE